MKPGASEAMKTVYLASVQVFESDRGEDAGWHIVVARRKSACGLDTLQHEE